MAAETKTMNGNKNNRKKASVHLNCVIPYNDTSDYSNTQVIPYNDTSDYSNTQVIPYNDTCDYSNTQ
jgi:hypothetical protein